MLPWNVNDSKEAPGPIFLLNLVPWTLKMSFSSARGAKIHMFTHFMFSPEIVEKNNLNLSTFEAKILQKWLQKITQKMQLVLITFWFNSEVIWEPLGLHFGSKKWPWDPPGSPLDHKMSPVGHKTHPDRPKASILVVFGIIFWDWASILVPLPPKYLPPVITKTQGPAAEA